jgi:hypothetical protein
MENTPLTGARAPFVKSAETRSQIPTTVVGVA